ncbi:transglutaminase domain-containing protein [Anaerobacillus sp. CMMVII]|uniref:transglutaminase-like domain-containing protein n=1 Tax=Anaerobacillus sp. CMMVII TaxID=2755588 RepID=UPI0021B7C0F9|nr:transglutaminase-like domain-containing protein [Anaerobacillus sp. CMMVII]MCT8136615.1 transglutaminase domain-containing protein [Anaerobacillus sp. CMMVII]
MLKNHNIFSFQMVLLYGLAFIVLWEWLRPLPVITDTGNLSVFVWFTLFCFILMYIRLVGFVAFPVIFIAIMYSLHSVFFEGSFLREGIATLVWFGEDFARNVRFLIGNDMNSLSFEFRSFLLFIVLAIMSYLIHFWLCHLKKIFLFLVITVVYVTVIDTFTLYDASNAIVRLVIAGFLLMTILYKLRLEEKEQVTSDEFKGKAWTNSLTFIIVIVAVIAFFSPKYEPYWPDPLPMVKGAMTGEGGEGTYRTIGYGQNDERLGGGFANDDTVIFTATATQGHYWRGESKEIYTGKGWESVEHELNKTFRYSDFYDKKVAVQMFERSVPKDTRESTISMVDDHRFWHLFYPGELVEVGDLEFYNEQSDYRYLIDYVSGKVGTTSDEKPVFLKEYTFTYHAPKFVIEDLRTTTSVDPDHIRDVYLQLPELPERVGQLASQITEAHENRYDKVKAIEGYFSRSGFQYETTDVAIPAEGQDYVDQFLFETQKGYCDNFSTSMIVMLRTLDIPARWVKGFTQGELVSRLDVNTYEISNANAHSWVEVYFPEVGWVPFEPTKGFNHTFEFVEDQQEVDTVIDDDNDSDELSTPERMQDPENPFLPLEDMIDSPAGGSSEGVGGGNDSKSLQFPFKLIWIVIAVMLVGFAIYRNHQKLLTVFFLYLFKLKSSDDENLYIKAYERLLWLLELNGFKRYDDETLREYANRIDGLFPQVKCRS